jgi:hypothetical protein
MLCRSAQISRNPYLFLCVLTALRYQGFSSLLHVFKIMGIFDDVETEGSTWNKTLENIMNKRGYSDLGSLVLSCSGDDKDLATRVSDFMLWLDLNNSRVTDPSSIVKSFCDILEHYLQYEENERDMVLMHHSIKAKFGDGSVENHSCSLQLFGDSKMTAMCKTVGYTAAIGTKLILEGDCANKKGLLLPTSKDVYIPSLELLKKEGITFEDHVHIECDYDVAV